MSSSSPLGFGIVGTGMIAEYHAKAISLAKGARLVGVAGRSSQKVISFAEKHGIPFRTTDLATLVSHPEINVICVATPSGAHLEPALAAVRAGKHLVVEKPVEITLDRVDRLLSATEQAGVKIAAIFQARFGEGARTLKAAIEAGRFGRLVLCSAYVKWHRKPEYYQDSWHGTQALDGGGAVMNQGIHAVDLLQWFAGMPTEVFGRRTRRVHTGIEVEDTACAALTFASGALGTIEASTALFPGWERRIEICGENGSARLEDDRLVKWDFRQSLPEDAAILAAAANNNTRSGSSAPNQISHEGHLRQIQDLIDGLRENRPLAIDGREARKAIALIRALYESADRGVPISLA
jgi:predicted dehydrogenase